MKICVQNYSIIKSVVILNHCFWSIIHNNASSKKKVNHLFPRTSISTSVFVPSCLHCKCCLICAYFSPDSHRITCFIEESNIVDRGFIFHWKVKIEVEKCLNFGFAYYKHSFSLHKMIIELLFWWHPFTTEGLIMSKWGFHADECLTLVHEWMKQQPWNPAAFKKKSRPVSESSGICTRSAPPTP